MSADREHSTGAIQPAPEGFLDTGAIEEISHNGIDDRRRALLKASFLGALAGSVVPSAVAAGDPDILQLPPWSTSLGNPVAQNPYGQPSQYEKNIVRRQSPGLTQTTQASVSFSPLQGMFGIITASGLHFERRTRWTVCPRGRGSCGRWRRCGPTAAAPHR